MRKSLLPRLKKLKDIYINVVLCIKGGGGMKDKKARQVKHSPEGALAAAPPPCHTPSPKLYLPGLTRSERAVPAAHSRYSRPKSPCPARGPKDRQEGSSCPVPGALRGQPPRPHRQGSPGFFIVGKAVEGTRQNQEPLLVPPPAPVQAPETHRHRAIALSCTSGEKAALAAWAQFLAPAWLHCQLQWPRRGCPQQRWAG